MRLVCTILCVGLFSGSTVLADLELRNGIAAIVNDAIITFQEVEEIAAPSLEVLRNTFYNQPAIYQQKRVDLLNDTLEHLIERQLILDDFKSSGNKIPENFIDDHIKNVIRKVYGDRVRLI